MEYIQFERYYTTGKVFNLSKLFWWKEVQMANDLLEQPKVLITDNTANEVLVSQ